MSVASLYLFLEAGVVRAGIGRKLLTARSWDDDDGDTKCSWHAHSHLCVSYAIESKKNLLSMPTDLLTIHFQPVGDCNCHFLS